MLVENAVVGPKMAELEKSLDQSLLKNSTYIGRASGRYCLRHRRGENYARKRECPLENRIRRDTALRAGCLRLENPRRQLRHI